jgi:hypothetical protein
MAMAASSQTSEEAMRYVGRLGALFLLCLYGSQAAQPQEPECGGYYACIGEAAMVETGSDAGPERCSGAPVDVTAASPEQRTLVCSAAKEALHLLGRCEISVRRALHVEIMSEVRHPFSGAIFGLFDIKQDKVLVTQEANIPSLVNDTPYAKLPLRDFYRSLIVHEVIHGVMHQNLKRPASSHAAYEYPAYALQIESLPRNVREQFLQSFEQDAIRADTIFNDTVLMFDPFFFAAQAYRHFKAAGDGCAHLNALLDGEVPFILPMLVR